MARVLPPWRENLGKRQVKAPKVYLRDSGLLPLLLGIGGCPAVFAADFGSFPGLSGQYDCGG
jgi:predicted AAA+ superfamily ATPase